MTPLHKHRQIMNITPTKMAEYMSVSRISLWRWEAGKEPVPQARMQQAERIRIHYMKFLEQIKEFGR